ncbi:NAD-dependent epimerase/dehydratase family protein [Streptomyces sp. NPDC054784]
MRILITGVAGLIGSNLSLDLLRDGIEVVGVDDLSGGPRGNVPHGVDLRVADIVTDPLDGHLAGVDAVFHLAAYSSVPMCQDDPVRAAEVNVSGTLAVLEAMRRTGVRRLIAAETSAVYEGTTVRPTPETEDCPQTVYGITKRCGARLLAALAPGYGVELTTLRYFNVYGERHDYTRVRGPVIPSFVRAALRGEQAVIYGDGTVSRDFVHVDDINRFHRLALADRRTVGGVYNLGTGETASVADIHAIVARETGTSLAPTFVEVDIPEAPRTLADITRARGVGWSPTISLADGIRGCIADGRRALLAEGASS